MLDFVDKIILTICMVCLILALICALFSQTLAGIFCIAGLVIAISNGLRWLWKKED